jgi:nitrogen fixation protein NifU and related proteins
MQFYNEIVLDHFKNPRNVGEIKDASGIGSVGNAACGDIMELHIKVKDNIIVDAKFKTFGCAAAIATSSVLTELVKGKSIEDALKIKKNDIIKELKQLPSVKIHCSVLGVQALKKAIDNYLSKQK